MKRLQLSELNYLRQLRVPVPVQPSVIFSRVDIVRDTTVTNGLRYWTPMLSSDLKRKVCSAQK